MKCGDLGNSGFNIPEITFGNGHTHLLRAGNDLTTVIGTPADRDRAQAKPPAAREA